MLSKKQVELNILKSLVLNIDLDTYNLYLEDFNKDNQKIYNSILKQKNNKNKKVDIRLMSQELKADYEKLKKYLNGGKAKNDIETEIKILKEYNKEEELNIIEMILKNESYNNSEKVEEIKERINNIELNTIYSYSHLIDDYNFEKDYEKIIESLKAGIIGFNSQLKEVNNIIKGFKGNRLITIAGRPGASKTTLMIDLSCKFMKEEPGIVISLEMSKKDLIRKSISHLSGISYNKILNGQLQENEIKEILKAQEIIRKHEIYYIGNDTINQNFDNILNEIKMLIRTKNIKFIFIDHIGLLVKNMKNEREELTEMYIQLKKITSRYNITTFVLSQLNRDVERNELKRPNDTNLFGSDGILQNSDIMILIYRPAYYFKNNEGYIDNVETLENLEKGINVVELIIAKNRHDGADHKTAVINVDLSKNRFYDLSEVNRMEYIQKMKIYDGK